MVNRLWKAKLSRAMLTAGALLWLALTQSVQAYVAIQNKADHLELRIAPAPGKVTIDGDLKDWDLSGAILMFMDAKSKPAYNVRGAMMYDKQYLYIGGHRKDPTPMVNQTAFGGEVNMAWNADAIQIFLVANPAIRSQASTMTGARMPAEEQHFVNYITLWYSTQDKAAGYFSFFTLGFKQPVLNPSGVKGVYEKDDDGKGCTFEYRVPWKVLRAPQPMAGGDGIQMLWRLHWGNDQGTELRAGMSDVRNPNSNALGYMGPVGWGLGRFMKTGNLPPAAKSGLERAEGHIPVNFKLASDGKVSISIRDARGKTVRTGIGAEPYPAGEHTWLWDGLDDRDNPLPAGRYTAMILTHDGIGQKYVCDVGVSGEPPYQTEDGTGGWAGDYWTPTYVAVEGDRVILGTCNAEAQKPTIGTDLNGRKHWGTTAAGIALALHKGFGYFGNNGNLTKFSLANGQLSPLADGRPNAKAPTGRGLAVLDDATLVSATGENKIFLIDLATGKQKREVALPVAVTPHTANRQVKAHNVHPMQVGDIRIVLARTADGKMIATRYRPKTQGKKPFAAYFETPAAGREDFDEIAEWNDLPMHYRAVTGGYVVEVAVPWSATALAPKPGLKFLADAGVIYGNAGGTRNAARAMWSDRTPEISVNNDVPTESRLHPNGWGILMLE